MRLSITFIYISHSFPRIKCNPEKRSISSNRTLKTRWKRCRGMCRLPCTRRGTAALPQRDDRININFVALLPRVCLNRGIIEGVADAFYVSFIHRSIRRRDNWGRNSTRVEHEAENSEKCSHPYLIAIVRNNEAYLSCSPHVRRVEEKE